MQDDSRREQILTMLRDHPGGIATLPLFERLGASSPAEREVVTEMLRRMAARGVVRRAGGVGLRAMWTLVPNAELLLTRPGGQLGGAGELARARARTAARQDGP